MNRGPIETTADVVAALMRKPDTTSGIARQLNLRYAKAVEVVTRHIVALHDRGVIRVAEWQAVRAQGQRPKGHVALWGLQKDGPFSLPDEKKPPQAMAKSVTQTQGPV